MSRRFVRSSRVLAVIVGAAVGVAAAGAPTCVHAQTKRDIDPPLDTVRFASELEVDLATSRRVTRGLYARDLVVGDGRTAGRGDQITVRYVGRLSDGRAFTTASEPPAEFKLGARTVIEGWDRGLSGMRVGGLRQLVIAPDLGYGKKGADPIPPNAVLVFEVELLSVR